MKRILIRLPLLLVIALLIPLNVFSQRGITIREAEKQRVALVIGNGAYESGPLRNPANDARDMAKVLKGMGFMVLHKENATLRDMDSAGREFGRLLKGGGVGLFYFAGHGIQVDGKNYLLPVDAKIEFESDVRFEAFDAGKVLGWMEDAGNILNIMILDACRINPFARSFRSSTPGLAKMDAPKGSLVAYATAPGSVADDGTDRNGIYTKYLLKHMNKPGLKVEEVLKLVRVDVMQETGDKQVPWEHSSLRGDFYFIIEGKVTVTDAPPAEGSAGQAWQARIDKEALFWESVKDSNETAVFEAYLEQFPEGTFAALARHKIEKGKEPVEVAVFPPEPAAKGRLFVQTEPEGARVRILNIRPIFKQGIELEPGKYHIEVSAKGFRTSFQWIDLAEAKEKQVTVKLAEEVNTGSIRITGAPEGAEVFLNNRFAGKVPVVLDEIRAGRHTLELSGEGYKAEKRQVELVGGEEASVRVDLETLITTGHLSVSGTPTGAKVYVDGSYAGDLPVSPREMKEGSYKVTVSAEGYEAFEQVASLSAGEDKDLEVRLKKSGPFTNDLGMEFVWIGPGEYMRGSPGHESGRDDDERQHRVVLTRGFDMQTTEVTVGQWRRFVNETGYRSDAERGGGAYVWTGKWELKEGAYWDNPGFTQGEEHPVTCVSWNDAMKFVEWMNGKGGGTRYCLPTEAEWEYAARAGSTTRFSFGDDEGRLGEYAWYKVNSGGRTHPVGTRKPNAWGLYDMHGNVWEWCADWYGDYPSGMVTDPAGASSGSSRVLRGGGLRSLARRCRSALRPYGLPGARYGGIGFRLVVPQVP